LLTVPDVLVDPFDKRGHARKDSRAIWSSTRNFCPAGHTIQFPVLHRAVDTRQRTTRVTGTRAATTLDVPGTDHVIREDVGVPCGLVACRTVEQSQFNLVQRARRFTAL